MVCHCLLIETADNLILIDTGVGTGAIDDPEHWLGRKFTRRNRPVLDIEETALHQVARLGYDPADVTDIVLTHLDRDHADGIADFPHARIHLHAAELRSARAKPTQREQNRYLDLLWRHGPNWVPDERLDREPWFGLPAIRDLDGLPAEIALIPLAGHTARHVGIAIDTGQARNPRWLLHAGDAYFHHREIDPSGPKATPGLAYFQRKAQAEQTARRQSQVQFRRLNAVKPGVITVFSAHDPTEFKAVLRPARRRPSASGPAHDRSWSRGVRGRDGAACDRVGEREVPGRVPP